MISSKAALLVTAAVLAVTTAASGQTAFDVWLNPQLGELDVELEYDGRAHFNADVGGQTAQMHMVRHGFRVRAPVFQNERDEWSVTLRAKALDIDTDARIPGTCTPFPDHLWDIGAGVTYRHRFDNDWIAGADLSITSPSDQPYNSVDEVNVRATAFARIPHGESNAWLLYLNYSNAREFAPGIPLPGFGYQFEATDSLRGLVGLPVTALHWEPIERLTLEGRYFVPRTVFTRISYRVLDEVRLYAGYEWDSEHYFRHDRRDNNYRLSYYEQRVVGGVRVEFNEHVTVDLLGGFAFERFWFEGENYGDRDRHRLNLDDGPLLRLQLAVRI